MQLHFQANNEDHIWAYREGSELDDCIEYCASKAVPYVVMHYEIDETDHGSLVIMSHEIFGHTGDRAWLIEHIRKRLAIFSDDLCEKIALP